MRYLKKMQGWPKNNNSMIRWYNTLFKILDLFLMFKTLDFPLRSDTRLKINTLSEYIGQCRVPVRRERMQMHL